MFQEGFEKFMVPAFLPRKLSFLYRNENYLYASIGPLWLRTIQLDLKVIVLLSCWEGGCVAVEINPQFWIIHRLPAFWIDCVSPSFYWCLPFIDRRVPWTRNEIKLSSFLFIVKNIWVLGAIRLPSSQQPKYKFSKMMFSLLNKLNLFPLILNLPIQLFFVVT